MPFMYVVIHELDVVILQFMCNSNIVVYIKYIHIFQYEERKNLIPLFPYSLASSAVMLLCCLSRTLFFYSSTTSVFLFCSQ